MEARHISKKTKRAGSGQLHLRVDKALQRALLIELAKNGYAKLSLGAVAHRAGAGKAAIYRRWSGKEEMVIDALLKIGVKLVDVDNTGSLYGDIHTYVSRTIDLLRRPLARKILPDLYAELTRQTDLAKQLKDKVHTPKQKIAKTILERAVERGELSKNFDMELALDMMIGPLYWRLIVSQSDVDATFADQFTAALLRAWNVVDVKYKH